MTTSLTKIAAQAFTTQALAEFEKRLEPGDVLLMSAAPDTGLSGKLFTWASKRVQGEKGHAALYAGDSKVYDTRFNQGTKLLSLRDAADGKHISALRPSLPVERKQAAVARADRMVGAPYAGNWGLFAKMLASKKFNVKEKPVKDIRDGLVCSRLVTRAYGNESFGLKRQPDMVYPSEFLSAPKLQHVAEFRNGLVKKADHAADRLKERQPWTALGDLKLLKLRLRRQPLPRGDHHARLGTGYAVLKDMGDHHVVATVLGHGMSRVPGHDMTTRLLGDS